VQNPATHPRIVSAALASTAATDAGEQPESSRYGVGGWQDEQAAALQSDIREINRLDGSSLAPGASAVADDLSDGDAAEDLGAEAPAQDCEFLHASEYQQAAGWHLQARSHSHHELLVVREGTLRCKVQGQVLTLQVGQALLVAPTVVHEEWTEGNGVRLLSVGFRWGSYRPGMPLEIKDEKGRLGELTEWLWSERHARFQDAGAFRQQLLRSLVCEYLRLSEQSGWQPQELDPQNPIVHNVSKFIREHMAEHFTLDDLAAQAKMSKFYFARAYRTLTGLSPMDHARLIRLEAARELLLTTNLPLKSIAPKVGFASEFHLSRLLRARLGVGARQIRARAAG
jgi:AraC-like DNA-binding protein/mannose-6-phosphate isomerase-like protein (cupin superfamily)